LKSPFFGRGFFISWENLKAHVFVDPQKFYALVGALSDGCAFELRTVQQCFS
jgi:hypothetical protein